ncbi:MAG: tetratricopeptide repeat protein [Acidobacteria bacterium]|nr:tetratricopeptide repeat protein [Acidobacteriota bacterium]MBV9148179.1 tetratricopeptide repeat protein [Acidobacteriota bacterium]MBV9434634.1 tetratricopeptide repeat protein [Acidobacteriota bacterium]
MKHNLQFLCASALALALSFPAFAANKDMIALQTQVQQLADQVQRLQQANDERFGAMRSLLEQNTDTLNRLSNSLDAISHSLQTSTTDQGGKVDQVSAQVQSLHDSVDELKARMAKISKQLDDMAAAQQNLQSAPPGGQPGQPGQATQPQQPQAPPPDVLYNQALSDYNGGKYPLASQEFSDYIKYYGNTDLAGNAQYYLADIEYRNGNYQQAAQDYDKVLEQYPSGNKAAAAQLKKGYALLQLDQRDAGVRELRALIARYPKSLEAQQARDRLRSLGLTATASKPSPSRR